MATQIIQFSWGTPSLHHLVLTIVHRQRTTLGTFAAQPSGTLGEGCYADTSDEGNFNPEMSLQIQEHQRGSSDRREPLSGRCRAVRRRMECGDP